MRAPPSRRLAAILAIVIATLMVAAPTSAKSMFTDRYDEDIRAAVKRWWPDYPFWLAWKAQLWQESKLDPNARSEVGAEGVAQFMEPSWLEVTKQIGAGVADRRNAKVAIPAGAAYMLRQRQAWRSPRPDQDRQELAQASYNAGAGSLIKAQKLCGNPPTYAEIVKCLPSITGVAFAKQTITYVSKIAEWWRQMELGR